MRTKNTIMSLIYKEKKKGKIKREKESKGRKRIKGK